MVAGFKHCVEHITMFNDMSAKCALAYVNASTWHVIYRAVTDGDTVGHRDLYRGSLLLVASGHCYKAILHTTFGRIVIGYRAAAIVNTFMALMVSEQWVIYALRATYECNAIGTSVMYVTSTKQQVPVVTINEYGVAAKLAELTANDSTVLGSTQSHSTTTVYSPVGGGEYQGGT